MQPFLPELGITRVANVTGLDHLGIPTVVVVRPNARSLSVSQGKGIDLVSAKVSGILEAAEMHLAEHAPRPPLFETRADLMKTHRVANTPRLPRYVRPFHDGETVLWTEGRDLATGEPIMVPYELVHLDMTLPLPKGSGFFPIGSNGLASGNAWSEAAAHALYELVERDALSLFYTLPPEAQSERRIDTTSVDGEICRELLARYEQAEIDVGIWDVTSDIGIAVFLCIVVDRDPNSFRPTGPARGSGCHADPEVALSRALSEAAQSRLTRITGARDDIRTEDHRRIRSGTPAARARAHLGPQGTRLFSAVPRERCETFEDEIAWASRRLRDKGLDELVAVDLSRDEYPFRVCRMIVPGLEWVSEAPGYRQGPRAIELRKAYA